MIAISREGIPAAKRSKCPKFNAVNFAQRSIARHTLVTVLWYHPLHINSYLFITLEADYPTVYQSLVHFNTKQLFRFLANLDN